MEDIQSPMVFAATVLDLRRRWAFSVSSWGRTVKHNASETVKGHPKSKHLWWLGLDVVLDDPGEVELFMEDARRSGLYPTDEGDHVHLQSLAHGVDPSWSMPEVFAV